MAENPTIAHPRRGEVYLVNFDPTIGAEIEKTWPALLLRNDIANRWSPITIVPAFTSRFEEPLASAACFRGWHDPKDRVTRGFGGEGG